MPAANWRGNACARVDSWLFGGLPRAKGVAAGGAMSGWMKRACGLAVALVGLAAALVPNSAEARWLRAESPHFVIYSDGDEGALRRYAQQLERFDQLLRGIHGMPVTGAAARRLPIYLVQNRAALGVVYPGAPDSLGGFYSASERDVFAVAVRTRGENDVVQHEYVHHFVAQNFANAFPSWLNEGYAEYFSQTGEQGRDLVFGRPHRGRGEMLLAVNWIPLQQVVTRRPLEFADSLARSQYYGQSWLMTHWFMSDTARRQRLFGYLREVAGGARPDEALERAAGMPLAALQAELMAYARGALRYSNIPLSQFSEAEVSVTTLPPAADDLLLLDQRLKFAPTNDAETVLQQVRAAAERAGDSPFARLVLARAEITVGDRARGDAALEQVLQAEPNNAAALELAAYSRVLAAGQAEGAASVALAGEARTLITRAFRADETHYQTLLLNQRLRRSSGDYPSDNDIETWRLALALAPQVSAVRSGAAEALTRRRSYRAAANLLAPLINDPHDRAPAEWRSFYNRLRRATDGQPLPPESAEDAAGGPSVVPPLDPG